MEIGQHIVGGFDGTSITKEVKILIEKYNIGGFILFSRNIESPRQVRELNIKLQKLSTTPLFLSVDQEGGIVARLKNPPYTKFPNMNVVGEYYRRTGDLKTIFEFGKVLGREVRASGFNWDYAPILDVHSNPKNPIIGNRSFGPDPQIVARCAGALIRGLHSEGVLSCAKHFPGHGATSVDSHKDLPYVRDPGRVIWKRDLFPYRKLISLGRIKTLMTAHVKYPDLDEKKCATLSYEILTNLLRHRLKFKGLIVSDDMWMKAIVGRIGIPQATEQFFKAGGDLTLICKDPAMQIETIEHIKKQIEKDKTLKRQLISASFRINKLQKQFCTPTLPPLSVIGSKAHQKIIDKIVGE